jgi:small subunit ribosomal protein S9
MPTKPEKSEVAKPKAPRKPRAAAVKKESVKHHEAVKHAEVAAEVVKPLEAEAKIAEAQALPKGRYIFATGRRKTSVANVRMFEGKGETLVNKKPLKEYFTYSFYQDEIVRPFEVTGLVGKYHYIAHINGGGPHSQAGALRHGIAIALGTISEDIRKVLKKNGFLTRDDRKKERKKPGLKRARRSPQWAKR